MNESEHSHLRAEEEKYVLSVFEQLFVSFRFSLMGASMEGEQLARARAFLSRIATYYEQLACHLSLAQVDALMLAAYMRVLDREQETRARQRSWLMALFPGVDTKVSSQEK